MGTEVPSLLSCHSPWRTALVCRMVAGSTTSHPWGRGKKNMTDSWFLIQMQCAHITSTPIHSQNLRYVVSSGYEEPQKSELCGSKYQRWECILLPTLKHSSFSKGITWSLTQLLDSAQSLRSLGDTQLFKRYQLCPCPLSSDLQANRQVTLLSTTTITPKVQQKTNKINAIKFSILKRMANTILTNDEILLDRNGRESPLYQGNKILG